jgi:hypothetical protein
MYTGDVWGITMIAVGLIATAAAFQVLATAVLGGRVEAASRAAAERPFAAIGLGILVLGAGIVLTAIAGAVPAGGKQAAVVLALGLTLVALLGWTASSRAIGERLPSPASAAWRATLRGAVASGLFGVVPVLGWVVLGLFVVAGTGAFAMALARSGDRAPAAAAA